jgi:hypothetical protein
MASAARAALWALVAPRAGGPQPRKRIEIAEFISRSAERLLSSRSGPPFHKAVDLYQCANEIFGRS